MAKLSHRFFALFFAILFLVTSSSVAVAFVLSNIESKNNPGSNTSATTSSSCPTTDTANFPENGQINNFTPVAVVPTLKISDLTVGSGQAVKPGATVCADYIGALASSGKVFQTSNAPISFSLSSVIKGWIEGIPGMKVGGTRQLLIPANDAYGASPPSGSGIPANAALVFNVKLVKILSN